MKFSYLLLLFLISTRVQSQTISSDSASQYSKDTVGIFQKVEIEAAYPGGEMAWRKYLEKNFKVYKVSDAVLDELPKKDRRAKRMVFVDTVQFIVCKDGSVCEIRSITNVPDAFKKETIRLISQSKLWQPATVNGRKVKAYRKQSISLVISSE